MYRRTRGVAPTVLAAALVAAGLLQDGRVLAADEPDNGEFGLDSLLEPIEKEEAPPEVQRAVPAEPVQPAEVPDTETADSAPAPRPTQSGRRLENIVVVAQKKEESIQDVPISISVLDDQLIEDLSLTDINSATLYAPNVKVADAGFFILPRIRGFGTDQNNKAFEPPAGVAIDGIPYTRLEYFTSALFDVDRLEILRGPQGTTFGKNTTAGLIHIITKEPTDTYEGFVDIQYGERGRERVEAGFGGPIPGTDTLSFRLAGLSEERDGFVSNSATPPVQAPPVARGIDRSAFRGKLRFADLFGSDLTLSYETSDVLSTGVGLEVFNAKPASRDVILDTDPNADLIRGNFVGSIDGADFRRSTFDTFNLDWRYDLGDWQVVGLAGYSVLEGTAAVDIDGTPVNGISGTDSDRSPTTTFELRTQSPDFDGLFGLNNLFGWDMGTSNLLTGLFYQRREIQGNGIGFTFGLPGLQLVLAGLVDNNDRGPAPVRNALARLFGLVPPFNIIPALGDRTETAIQDFDQTADATGLFSQFEWRLSPTWGIQYGIRFNQEDKQASFNQQYAQPDTVLLPLVNVDEFQAERSISESQVAQRLAFSYQPSDNFGVFLHGARGFRGGGFNAFARGTSDEELLYGAETATDIGLDFKTQFWDGSARLNISLFRLDVEDFQVLTGRQTDGAVSVGLGQTIVENAPKARSQGLEADFTWLPFQWLTTRASLGINDTEYLDFTFNGCFPDNPNTDGDDDPRCDATGKPFPLTPKYNATLLGLATIPLSRNGLVMQIGAGLDFQSSQFTNTSLDPRFEQDPVTRYRATLGIGNIFQGWSFKLQGENLTNEVTTVRQGQTFSGYVIEGLEAPRTIYGVFRYNFQ